MATPAHDVIDTAVEAHRSEILELRRDLHAHPELSWHEQRTTDVVASRLEAAGLAVRRLTHTGLIVDVGDGPPRVALRADLDALPVEDLTTDPWVSTRPGVAHACGHDVHTAGLVGAGLALAARAPRGRAARRRTAALPAGRGGDARRGDLAHRAGRPRGRPADLLPALRPDPRPRPGRGPRGPDHRRGRPARGPADRRRRAHLPPAPHRGPHLRAGQADHRAARGALPPARPARRCQRGVGHGPRGRRPQRHPRGRHRRRHRPDARRGRLVARRAAGARVHRRHRGAVRRQGRGRLPPRRPAGRQRRGRHRAARWRRGPRARAPKVA